MIVLLLDRILLESSNGQLQHMVILSVLQLVDRPCMYLHLGLVYIRKHR